MGRERPAELDIDARYRHWRDAVTLASEGIRVRDHRGLMFIPWETIRTVETVLRPAVELRQISFELVDGTAHVLPAPIDCGARTADPTASPARGRQVTATSSIPAVSSASLIRARSSRATS